MGESEQEKTENGTPQNGEAHAGMTAPTGEEKASGGKDAADCKSAEKAGSCASE